MACPSSAWFENRLHITPSIRLAQNPKCVIVQWVGIGTHTFSLFSCYFIIFIGMKGEESIYHPAVPLPCSWGSVYQWPSRHSAFLPAPTWERLIVHSMFSISVCSSFVWSQWCFVWRNHLITFQSHPACSKELRCELQKPCRLLWNQIPGTY